MTLAETPDVRIPDSPVGQRVRWIFDQFKSDDEVTAEMVREVFAESFLTMAPAEAIAGMFNDDSGTVANAKPSTVTTPTDYSAKIELSDGENRLRMTIAVEPEKPNRIALLSVDVVYPAAAGAVPIKWAAVSGGEPVREEREGPGGVDSGLSNELEKLITEAREENHIVGLAASVAGPQGLVWFRGFGRTRSDGGEVRPETVFRIGSVSKTMTAIGVMQLVEAGKVLLDDPVNDHLSSYKVEAADGSEPITIRHLLTHTSGLAVRGGIDLGVPYGQSVPSPPDFYAAGLRARRPAGEKWIYSNDAFTTLGHLIEEFHGKPFPDVMGETLFAPLDMASSSFVRGPAQAERLVTGFSPHDEGIIECVDLEPIVRGAGSVYSTAEDMGRYAACLMNGGAPVLKKESLEEMWARHYELPQEGINGHMGLGFIVHDVDGHRVPWHNGGWPGAATSMYVAADHERSVVLTANTFGGQISPALDRLGMKIIRRLLGLAET